MIPKTIHLCWFSDDPFPAEIKRCLASWRRCMPGYTIRRWTMADARAIGCPYIDRALELHRWAFAADAVRFYAVWKEGGIYMDSDIMLYRNFESLLPESGCATFHDFVGKLQAAFFMGEKGNAFCREMYEHYNDPALILPDGTLDETVSHEVMADIAEGYGYKSEDSLQRLDGLTIYPTTLLPPSPHTRKHDPAGRYRDAIGLHLIYDSWRQHRRSRGRMFELWLKHIASAAKWYLLRK